MAWRNMADFVAVVAENGGLCRILLQSVADFVGFCHDFVCQFSEFGNGKKDGYGSLSILNGKTLRRASYRFSLCPLCPLW